VIEILNRQQRRQIERETKQQTLEYNKNLKWFQNWTPSQLEFHKNMIAAIAKEADKETELIMDSCYIAAMIQELDISLEQCIDICRLADIHMNETRDFVNKEGERYFMKANNEELRNEIKIEIKTLIKENRKINNLEIIRILQETYDFPKKDFQILIKESREELSNEALQEIEKDIQNDEINSELSDREKEIELSELPEYAIGEIKSSLYFEGEHGFEMPVKKQLADELLEGLKKMPSSVNGLEIESITIKGVHGRYFRVSEGVKIGDKLYKNIEEVNKEKKIVYKSLNDEEIKLKKRIEDLNNQLQNVETRRQERNEMYAEIEAVFQM
jgi:hypothetical protein